MNLQELLDNVLFSIGEAPITVGNLALGLLSLICLSALAYLTLMRWIPRFAERMELSRTEKRRYRIWATLSLLLLAVLILALSMGINPVLYGNESFSIRLSTPIGILLAWSLARLTDLFVAKVLEKRFEKQRQEAGGMPYRLNIPQKNKKTRTHTIQYVVYLVALLILLNIISVDPSLGNINLGQGDPVSLTISKILLAAIILLMAQVIVWVITELVLYRYYHSNDINVGSRYAINQLIRYVVFVIAVLVALQNIGLNMTVIWGGAAALLVGIGLGLQQTFNDFFSGLVLLFERSVEVGDVVDMGGLVGNVRRIGLRSSRIQTRDNLTVVVPNSKLVVENVVNWSHGDNRARFHVNVGVAYGSDTDLVKKILLEAAEEHEMVLKYPRAFVRFLDFGNSSLDFQLHFWSTEFILIENVKSDLRFLIDKAFRENKVTIPFPQRDVWFKNAMETNPNGQSPVEKPEPDSEDR